MLRVVEDGGHVGDERDLRRASVLVILASSVMVGLSNSLVGALSDTIFVSTSESG